MYEHGSLRDVFTDQPGVQRLFGLAMGFPSFLPGGARAEVITCAL